MAASIAKARYDCVDLPSASGLENPTEAQLITE